jgi:hypothetical protein
MLETISCPTTEFHIRREGQLESGFGHLIRQPGDRYWLFVNDETLRKSPHLCTTLPIDPALLKASCDGAAGSTAFFYHVVFEVPAPPQMAGLFRVGG